MSSDKADPPRLVRWRRPPGPVNVWRIVDGEETLDDGSKRPVRLSIQEVPEERREEALQLMIKHFLADEPICKCYGVKDDPKYTHDFVLLWKYVMENHRIVEAAYKIDSDGRISDLAAVNVLYVEWEGTDAELELLTKKMQSDKFMRTLNAMLELSHKADARKIFGVDKYLSALGLCVAPRFRGKKLGLRMLEARNEIGQKYEIPVSSTIFTATASQILAERAGYKVEYAQDYADFKAEDGTALFPNIETKEIKVMMKALY
ncbi:uncharacterized protein LOC100678031 [Nasonia vitripennis]|uniref:N-acetyltransferase domain-containing protein n=1 Tax=Nasonia vitripennis TaxID=7425 RepID=A0A7M7HEX4_NASVI|nr:uncharacterized protein LOC100678031 [Nasonia vitripennis]XP_008212190.1 uncharacterized protein LOC100678031 [Nasonia vitripennis]XP_016844326.1 uncharacterized protein LOC100678031 [Nasonia vitripennis]